ncbi:hypothetical protein ABZ208_13800 [Streptomyces sp. NPDC006208]|uniref:hypothetical protein n=1 Tax=Streptomyces sp. NPDC006208 TaxID=3156734 RepID=UPI0033A78CF9
MNQLPDRAPVGQPLTDEAATLEARRLIREALQEEPAPTSYRDPTPLPTVGNALPVAQPGRPPMSQKATDASALMLAAGVASLPIGGMTSLVLYTLGTVDPTTLAIGATAPVALILAVGALIRSVGRAKADMHTEHHHHYRGPVQQQTIQSSTRLWGKTTNNL